MRRFNVTAVALAVLATLAPVGTMGAQRPLSLGVAGGVSLPQGAFGDVVDAGWHALGTLALGVPALPLGLRLDGAYSRFGFSARPGVPGGGARRVASVTINPTYRLPMTASPISPYVIAGAGLYNSGCVESATCGGRTRFSWNGGVGVKFAALGLKGFAETRYHHVPASVGSMRYVPITLGLLF